MATITSIHSSKLERGVYWRERGRPRPIEGPIWQASDDAVRIHDGSPMGVTFARSDFERLFAPVPLSELRAWYNGSQTVIAFSPLDASRVYAEHIGEAHNDAAHPWREWTEVLSFVDAADDLICGTPDEMIEEYGRGFLCSEDR